MLSAYRDNASTQSIMRDVLIALVPALMPLLGVGFPRCCG